jgi:hypothetical protein
MKKIKLTKGECALVDDDDFEKINQWKWSLNDDIQKYPVRRQKIDGKYKKVWLHRFIMETPNNMECDHINRNTLDNRKSNLRNCTRSENQRNTLYKKNKCGFRGVSFKNKINKWQAEIQLDNKQIYLGVFESPELAAKAYNIAANKYHANFKTLNTI